MQITHEEAHRLIQFDADGELKPQQRNLLASHFQECATCQQYADSIVTMESILRPMLQRNWDQEHRPLPLTTLMAKEKSRGSDRLLMATRIAAMAVAFLAFFASAWNLTLSSRRTPTPFLQSVPVIPTPFTSTMTAGTQTGFENCTVTSYTVQENDTLASIADRFAIPAEHIRQMNPIRSETLTSGQLLSIPLCNLTPANPTASHTTTFTPVLYSSTTTPGG
jgi:hypothetical protein